MKIKKTLTLLTAVCMMLTFTATACDNSDGNKQSADKVSANGFTLSAEDAAKAINAQSNLFTNELPELNIPEKIGYISSFTLGIPEPLDNKANYGEFMDVFAEFFPEHAMNRDFLYYAGKNSKIEWNEETEEVIQYYNLVDDRFDDIMSGAEDVVYYFYDTEKTDEVEENIHFDVCSPFGSAVRLDIKRGKIGKIMGEDPLFEHPYTASELSYSVNYETYEPDSDKVFKLADKEVSIKDAVAFYENFVKSLPMSIEPNVDVKVDSVNVFKITNDTYCYFFDVWSYYKNVPFDVPVFPLHTDFGYDFMGSSAAMIQSDEIEEMFGLYRSGIFADEKPIEEILSFEDVCEKVSVSLSNEVDFEVKNVSFVYCPEKMWGKDIKLSDYHQKTAPAWRFTMYNANDGKTYVAYVDAQNGENFRYYLSE
jgi:hypothetical protein